MRNKNWYLIWAGLFILCALLGFIPAPDGLLKGFLCLVSVLFYIPGWVLLYQGNKKQDLSTLQAISVLSAVSLCFTLVFLLLYFASFGASEAAGKLLYGFLVIFSTPMVCSQYWFLSIFLWACLMITGFSRIRQIKKRR